eukprot:5315945-Amphidinium_carterae.1
MFCVHWSCYEMPFVRTDCQRLEHGSAAQMQQSLGRTAAHHQAPAHCWQGPSMLTWQHCRARRTHRNTDPDTA